MDPVLGHVKYHRNDFISNWIGKGGEMSEKGIFLSLEPTDSTIQVKTKKKGRLAVWKALFSYMRPYRKYFILIGAILILGCLFQLLLPFLTKSTVDVGIKEKNIKIIWLVLAGEILILLGRTITDFVRNWIMLHITTRINLSMLIDFFVKFIKNQLELGS